MWQVKLSSKAQKQSNKLPKAIKDSLTLLLRELEALGAVRGNWLNYSKLSSTNHHCHLRLSKLFFFMLVI